MSAYRCARCNRKLSFVTVIVGSHAVGPTCAKKMGITPPKPTRKKKGAKAAQRAPRRIEVEVHVDQLGLFEAAA